MRRRVVITGLGIICPIGNNLESVWEASRNGISGTGRITKFDPSDLKSQIAGEVHDFEIPSVIPPKDVKKNGHLHPLCHCRSPRSIAGRELGNHGGFAV
jgi:3-oxoacyl-[acyl-carrier-protein] synthase II